MPAALANATTASGSHFSGSKRFATAAYSSRGIGAFPMICSLYPLSTGLPFHTPPSSEYRPKWMNIPNFRPPHSSNVAAVGLGSESGSGRSCTPFPAPETKPPPLITPHKKPSSSPENTPISDARSPQPKHRLHTAHHPLRHRALQHVSTQLLVTRSPHAVSEEELHEPRIPARRAYQRIDPSGIVEEPPLNIHRVRQIVADLRLPRPLITRKLRSIEAPRLHSIHRSHGRKIARDHRVHNALCRKRIHKSARISRQQNTVSIRPRQWAADRNRERLVSRRLRLAGDKALRLHLFDPTRMMLLPFAAQLRQVVIQLAGKAEVHMLTLRKDVSIAKGLRHGQEQAHRIGTCRLHLRDGCLFHRVHGKLTPRLAYAQTRMPRDQAVCTVRTDHQLRRKDAAIRRLHFYAVRLHRQRTNRRAHLHRHDRSRPPKHGCVKLPPPHEVHHGIGLLMDGMTSIRAFEIHTPDRIYTDFFKNIFQIRKSHQRPRSDASATGLLARKLLRLFNQKRLDARLPKAQSRRSSCWASAHHNHIKICHIEKGYQSDGTTMCSIPSQLQRERMGRAERTNRSTRTPGTPNTRRRTLTTRGRKQCPKATTHASPRPPISRNTTLPLPPPATTKANTSAHTSRPNATKKPRASAKNRRNNQSKRPGAIRAFLFIAEVTSPRDTPRTTPEILSSAPQSSVDRRPGCRDSQGSSTHSPGDTPHPRRSPSAASPPSQSCAERPWRLPAAQCRPSPPFPARDSQRRSPNGKTFPHPGPDG